MQPWLSTPCGRNIGAVFAGGDRVSRGLIASRGLRNIGASAGGDRASVEAAGRTAVSRQRQADAGVLRPNPHKYTEF
ncbi:MAG: hypothetical protein LBG74_00820 [Spirochaetaceae bacterium]|nr:hypothetical protein [Spirochaetaceae bacterium]